MYGIYVHTAVSSEPLLLLLLLLKARSSHQVREGFETNVFKIFASSIFLRILL